MLELAYYPKKASQITKQLTEMNDCGKLADDVNSLLGKRRAAVSYPNEWTDKWMIYVPHSSVSTGERETFREALTELAYRLLCESVGLRPHEKRRGQG